MKRAISFLLTLVMILGLFPMAAFAEDTTKPVVHLTADKTSVLAGQEVTLTLALDGDISSKVAGWEWDMIYDSKYFEITGSQVGTAAQPVIADDPDFAVTPIVNHSPKTKDVTGTYVYASVTSGNSIVAHYLKKGTIATLTLKAKEDIEDDISSKFYFVPIIVMNSSGTALDVVDADSATNWGKADFLAGKMPADEVGVPITITKPADPIHITAYYADKTGIVTGKDGTLLNFAPVTVEDLNGDGKFTMQEGFIALHETYYAEGAAGYEGENWVTKFWGVQSADASYVHNHRWVYSPQEEIAEGDSISFFWYQDVDLSDYMNSYSDLYTYFDSLTATATAGQEASFHVNGYSVFGSGKTADAIAAPEGATVTATCEGQDALTTTVDANGDFKLTFPAAGEWTVLVNGKCTYTATAGYYANKTYTDAPVVPAQMTVTVEKAPVKPIDITVYYADNGTIVTGKDGTLLNYAPVTVSDVNGDGKLTMYDGFACFHDKYHVNGAAGYEDNNWITKFWSVNTAMVSYGHNNGWVYSTAEEIADGDSLCLFTYQDQMSWSDLFTYFDSLTATATANEETTFHVNGYSFFGSSKTADATAAPVGATVTATCGDKTLTTTTDAKGEFKLTFPAAGEWTVRVSGTCSYTCAVGYYAGQTYTNAPVAPAQMTVTVEAGKEPDPQPPVTVTGYSLTMPDSKTVVAGETVQIAPVIGYADETVATYNAFDLTFTFDASALELTSTTIEGLTVTAGEGTVRVQGYGADRAVGTAPFTLSFQAKTTGSSDVTVTSAKVDISGNAIDKDAPEATLVKATTAVGVTGYPVTLPENFSGSATAEPGKDYTFTEPKDYYDYDVTVKVNGTEVEVTESNGSYTIPGEQVTGSITVTATKTGKKFSVTLGTDMTGEATAQYMTPYTATLNKKNGYTYDVSVTIGGKAYTGYTVSEGVYTIPGADITGQIVFTVTRTAIEGTVFTVTVEGTGAGDVKVNDTQVAPDSKLTFSVSQESGYLYDVSVTMGGEAASFTKVDNEYTIDCVTGNVVITVNKALDLSNLELCEYVQLDGKTVFLVHLQRSLANGKALAYDGNAMFYGRYAESNSWSYLVIVDEGMTFTAEDAKAKITVTESSYTTLTMGNTDVNESGLTDINDAQLVYDIYNGKYESFDTVTMRKFLYADVNGDKAVNVTDAAAVVAAIQ